MSTGASTCARIAVVNAYTSSQFAGGVTRTSPVSGSTVRFAGARGRFGLVEGVAGVECRVVVVVVVVVVAASRLPRGAFLLLGAVFEAGETTPSSSSSLSFRFRVVVVVVVVVLIFDGRFVGSSNSESSEESGESLSSSQG